MVSYPGDLVLIWISELINRELVQYFLRESCLAEKKKKSASLLSSVLHATDFDEIIKLGYTFIF